MAVPIATNSNLAVSTIGHKAITLQGSDPDGTPLTFALLSQPTHGLISGFNPATGALIYTPAFGYTGADSFTFKVTSGGQDSNTATVALTIAADKTRIVDYVRNAGGVGQVGTVTFVLTAQASAGDGLIAPASSVSAQTDAQGKYDLSVIASANLTPEAYYQVYFQAGYGSRQLLGIYDIPVSATPVTLQSYKVTDTNLAARYTFAAKSDVDSLQTANAKAVFQSLVPSGAVDGQLFAYDGGSGRLKTSAITEQADKIQINKPLGDIEADSLDVAAVTGATATLSGVVTAQAFVGNGAGITGLAGATGGVTNTGSTSIIADSDSNGVGVVDQIVGPTTVTRTHADRFQLFKPLELPSATVEQIAAMSDQALMRASDGTRGLYIKRDGQAVSLNGRVFDVAYFGAGPGRTAAQNSAAIAAALAAAQAAGGGTVYFPESLSYDTTISLPANNICLAGGGRGTVLTLTSNSTGVSFNGKDYCEIRDLSLFETAGGLGIHFAEISHHNLVRNVYLKGWTDAAMRMERSFYANVISCEIEECNYGVDLKGEANGNYFFGNNLRECRIGYLFRDNVLVGSPAQNVPSNENTVIGGLIEASSYIAGIYPGQPTACIEIAGCYLNAFVGVRMENVLATNNDNHTHVRITSGGGNVTRETTFMHCPIKGTDKAFVVGDASGSNKVFGTTFLYGRAYYGKINASAVGTIIRAAQGTYYGLTDNGTGSDVDIGPGADERYVKPLTSTAKAFATVIGEGSTVWNYYANAEQVGFTGEGNAHQRKVVDIGGTKVPVLQIGAWRLWVDDSGRLRIQGSDPTSLTGGTIVGTQS